MTDKPSNDDIMDERIRSLASEQFNAPGTDVPREAMWEAIASARRAARATAAATATSHAPVPIGARRVTQRTAWRWGAVLAAGLILGVAVDRHLVGPRTPTAETRESTAVRTPTAHQPDSFVSATTHVVSGSTRSDRSTPNSPRRASAPSDAARDTPQMAAANTSTPDSADSTTQSFYRSAATQTLVQAEALLTSYRSGGSNQRDPQAMQQAARWARDVLSSTRLLIDSPAGRDPQMRALFSDLELILAQLVQISGTPLRSGEREVIERAMRDHNLLPRLRSAVPLGLAAS